MRRKRFVKLKVTSFAVGLILSVLISLITIDTGLAQSGRKPTRQPAPSPTTEPNEKRVGKEPSEMERPMADDSPVSVSDDGTIKLDTSLVNIPVTVSDHDGRFIADLTKRDFRLYEDGIEQRIDSLQSISVPFNVILMIDTSGSTRFKLDEIQNAAIAFVNQLREDDRVMVLSFSERYQIECDFTSDRARLRDGIRQTRTGGGTKLYEAVEFALGKLEKVEGRKAVVLFTDGVDTSSRRASAESTIAQAEESGAMVYPISYDTEGALGGYGSPSPRGRSGPGRGPLGMPPIYSPFPMPGGRTGGRRWPVVPQTSPLTTNFQWPQGRMPRGGNAGDYQRAAKYLQDLADLSGGRLYKAESISSVSSAFTGIAEELRHQYALNYYPTNGRKDGTYRRIRVETVRPNQVVRARKGYRAAKS